MAGAAESPDPPAQAAAGRRGPLSPREREVLEGLAAGLTGEQVALELVLSAETVKTHVRNAMGKLGARTRTHAVVLALRAGEIDGPPAGEPHGQGASRQAAARPAK